MGKKEWRAGVALLFVAVVGCKDRGEARILSATQESAAPALTLSSVKVTPDLYFVDAHSQMDHRVDERTIISLMNRGGVHVTLLSAHMYRPWTDIPEIAARHPGRIVPTVRVKGKGYHKGPERKYYSRLTKQLGHGAFRAMAEAHIVHDSLGGKFQEVRISFDDPLFRAALDGAKQKGWPFVVHIEFNALDEAGKRLYMGELERFLRANRGTPILLIHMAQLEAGPVRRLLDAHPNLHFMTSHSSPRYQGTKAFINMFDGQSLKAEWKQLMIDYPDRFVFALDNVFDSFWTDEHYLGKMKLWWSALGELPDEVSHSFAHGNAERLWNLLPKAGGGMVSPSQGRYAKARLQQPN